MNQIPTPKKKIKISRIRPLKDYPQKFCFHNKKASTHQPYDCLNEFHKLEKLLLKNDIDIKVHLEELGEKF